MSLDPSPEEMRRIGRLAADRIAADRDGLRAARPFTPPDPGELEALLAEPLPRTGHGYDACIDRFFDTVLPRATRVDHPRFFAYVPAPGSFAGALGEWLGAAAGLFVGTWIGGASLAQLEVQVLDWLREALGLPAEWSTGVLTTGGSLANLQALAAARERTPGPLASKVVYTSAEAHFSVLKAARILGFETEHVRALPVDFGLRLKPAALDERCRADRDAGLTPCAVVATLGTTSTGAIDDVAACREIADRHGAWLHVDGAYGAALALCPEHDALRDALHCADSLTLDPHKWLYAPIESGCLLTRHRGALEQAFAGAAHGYMQDVPEDAVNFFARGPELTRGARAVKLWLLLRAVGVDRITTAIRADCALARRAHDALLEDPEVVIVTEPALSVFTFRVGDEARTRAVLEAVNADGRCFLSSSRVAGSYVIRFCVVNHRSTEQDVDEAVAAIRAAIARIAGAAP